MLRLSTVLVAFLCTRLEFCLANAGSVTGRIVGGSDADDISVPFMASVLKYGHHVCGGSIINERTILTAAHCVRYTSSDFLKVRVGTKTKSLGQLLSVESTFYHTNFQPSTMDFDIGIIRLHNEIEFSDLAHPIALQQPGTDLVDETDALVTGWGFTTQLGSPSEFLKYAIVPIINQATCNRLLEDKVTDRMIGAGYPEGGIDACAMDSGGPLVVDSKLVGIVSWGLQGKCAAPKVPGVYTRVSVFYNWVEEYLSQFGEKLQ